jgi:hypothetical protein
VGYVPDYLANELAEAQDPHSPPDAAPPSAEVRAEVLSAERVNHPPAAPIYSVLCRYTCSAALGSRLFRSERYQPLSPDSRRA